MSRTDLDHGGLVRHGLGRLRGRHERVQVVHVFHRLHVPAVRLVALAHVLREGQVRLAVDGDLVVVVEDDELAQAQVARQGAGLGGDALLQAAVAADDVGVVVHHGRALAVVDGRQVRLRHGQAHGVGDSL